MDDQLASELARMAAEDQRVRQPPPGAEREFVLRVDPQTRMEAQRVDVANTARLCEIISQHGWPGRSLVGDEGAHHAWLIAQHADRQLDFQREALALLADAVGRGDAAQRDLAYLTDRVRMNEGREQVFGTQIAEVKDGNGVPWPVEDPTNLDARRAAVGLPPFEEYSRDWPSSSRRG
ncbi:MAG TPA: DUF6624 domain-containing protein [Thermoleophilaceae bacterium]|nr:DUF6624 domain-containing protein [Thermoleophilaceae bacterium]